MNPLHQFPPGHFDPGEGPQGNRSRPYLPQKRHAPPELNPGSVKRHRQDGGEQSKEVPPDLVDTLAQMQRQLQDLRKEMRSTGSMESIQPGRKNPPMLVFVARQYGEDLDEDMYGPYLVADPQTQLPASGHMITIHPEPAGSSIIEDGLKGMTVDDLKDLQQKLSNTRACFEHADCLNLKGCTHAVGIRDGQRQGIDTEVDGLEENFMLLGGSICVSLEPSLASDGKKSSARVIFIPNDIELKGTAYRLSENCDLDNDGDKDDDINIVD